MRTMKTIIILLVAISIMGCDIPKGSEPPEVYPKIYTIDIPYQNCIYGQITEINPSITLMRPHIVLDTLIVILTGNTDRFLEQIKIGDYIEFCEYWWIELGTGELIETNVEFIRIFGNVPPGDMLN